MSRRVLIMGAAGRDFHNFNTVFRDDAGTKVVAFTATQIPFINDRRYPPSLAGPHYPDGIQIYDESELVRLIRELDVDDVVFTYSDVTHEYVMHKALDRDGGRRQLRAPRPRRHDAQGDGSRSWRSPPCGPGSGKSQTTRAVAGTLKDAGKRVVAVRHPMPYGDLAPRRVQRFASFADLDLHECTIEEREEYEPHLRTAPSSMRASTTGRSSSRPRPSATSCCGTAGTTTSRSICRRVDRARRSAPRRTRAHLSPGETNLRRRRRRADQQDGLGHARAGRAARGDDRPGEPGRRRREGELAGDLDDPDAIAGKRVLVIEDGPTLTHGEMKIGAGVVAAQRMGAAEIVDPRPWAVGTIAETFEKYDVGARAPGDGLFGRPTRGDGQDHRRGRGRRRGDRDTDRSAQRDRDLEAGGAGALRPRDAPGFAPAHGYPRAGARRPAPRAAREGVRCSGS